eukprot:superscaffoldBa00002988_g15827
MQVVMGLDSVTLLNPPEEPLPDYDLEILYSCDQSATVQLNCVVCFDTGITSTLLLRQWSCVPGDPKIRILKLNLPDWLVYQADGIVPDSQWVLSCILQASVRYSEFDDTERSSAAQDVATLQPKPPFSRPVKQHQLCFAWSTLMLQLTQQFLKKQCPLEQETVHLLSSVYASTGENFGIIKTLHSYNSEVLEYLRLKSISFPWCMFSIWIFVNRYCQNNMCGVFHHIDTRNNYATPTLFLTNSGGKRVSLPAVGRALYSLSLHKLGRASSTEVISRIFPLLLQAGCLADNRALHMSSVLYSTEMGVRKQPNKAWLLALLAAQKDDRLALLHLGHLHYQGLHGVPADPDVAYAYYANIAKQTTLDRVNPSPQQTFVEAVYLNNEEVLNLQTNEDHHIFQWLRLQARSGAAEAEQAIAQMLFWGQQGVSPNIQKAVRHYERGAVQWKDPESMYNYGITLLQCFSQSYVPQGFVPAINALAWYYEQFEQDYVQAVQMWEQADLLESSDAALNLGIMYSQGLYPGQAADQYMAYKYYLKSAERGHIRGAILVADIWNTGIPRLVNRRPSDAILWVKWAAEHNGYLGSILRRALDSYLKSDTMGDLWYEGQIDGQKDLFSAAEMYKLAAQRNEPQGWYNLGLLAEEGYRLPLSVLIELGLSELYLADKTVLLSALYK